MRRFGMRRERRRCSVWLVVLSLFAAQAASAILIDFEDGRDSWRIRSTIPGFEFTTTNRNDWVYADWRTGDYNGPYPDGAYYSNGNFFAWLDTTGDEGIVTFTASHATYLTIGYSSESVFYIEAYDDAGNMLDSDSGASNLNTGRMNFLTVEAPGMRYVLMHDSGNHWLVDDLETDAVTECLENADCDDGMFCNGQEQCIGYICYDGEEAACPDDGVFCNGAEYCDEELGCVSEGDPCPDDGNFCNGTEYCDNVVNACANSPEPCPDDGLWCNGEEACDEDGDYCYSSEEPCDGECDEENDECVEDEDDDDPAGEDLDVTSAGGCGC